MFVYLTKLISGPLNIGLYLGRTDALTRKYNVYKLITMTYSIVCKYYMFVQFLKLIIWRPEIINYNDCF